MLTCAPYSYRYTNHSQYLFGFEGVPFNFTVNSSIFLVCIGFYLVLQKIIEREFVPKKNFQDNAKTRRKSGFWKFVPYFLKIRSSEFAKRAGLDGVAYILAMRFRVFQVFSLTPIFVICSPLFFLAQESENGFRQLTIANLGITDVSSGCILYIIIVISITSYFIATGFCFTEAYIWPRKLKICNSWKTSYLSYNDDKSDESNVKANTGREVEDDSQSDQRVTVVQDDNVDTDDCECDRINQVSSVLMLTGVPNSFSVESFVKEIKKFFEINHPGVKVQWIEPVYLARQLMELEQAKNETEIYLRTAVEDLGATGKQPIYYKFGICYHPLPLCKSKANAIEVYNEQLDLLQTQINTFYTTAGLSNVEYLIKENAGKNHIDLLNIPHTGIVFIGLENSEQALRLLSSYTICPLRIFRVDNTIHIRSYCKHHRPWSNSCSVRKPKNSHLFNHIHLAPPPSDLLWLNITSTTYQGYKWWLRVIAIRLAVVLLAFLLTSPVYILTIVNSFGLMDWLGRISRPFLFKWIPAAILAGASVLLTRLVIISEYWTRHKTRGGLESVIYRNAYWFLFVTVLLLPSLGITGFPALIRQIATTGVNSSNPFTYYVPFQVECIFLPDSGALFINYVVTCGLLGTGLQLLRLGHIFQNLIRRCFYTHTVAERKVFSEPRPEAFAFGENYAFLSVVHTIIIAYTPICPIIYFFGLIYFLFKFLIDKYMLVWIYSPLQSDIRGWSETDTRNYQYIYHMKWFIQSTQFSLTGICMASINVFAFYSLRWSSVELRPLIVAYFVLTIVTAVISVILSSIVEHYLSTFICPVSVCRKYYGHCRKLHDCKRKSFNEDKSILDTIKCTCPKLYADMLVTQNDYTVPVLRKFKQ
ncbi:CSC1-like protein 2 [Schistosoma japonicum]|nr:CSC1-like protein 2 [Schistosoma japonicum]KAH8867842.1 CSC1-like protein 2 [Schistosoma japonicum]KAH8867843.1 CSC1-like protein 2 [Schistosoma japonicum]KAH8867844.1 CSC1-like protein 2 [Schistosoma japonicum]KAH8867845.1 CSC1-like protein 2 [Schistosoma japonicum]